MIYFTFHITRPTIALNYQIDQIRITHSNKVCLQVNIPFQVESKERHKKISELRQSCNRHTACVTSPGRNKGQ